MNIKLLSERAVLQKWTKHSVFLKSQSLPICIGFRNSSVLTPNTPR
uniref:Uncharacterized protein n=1 Tax=Arundo donax TaxID=35708 RepID=A0A0A9N6F0_ARUDO